MSQSSVSVSASQSVNQAVSQLASASPTAESANAAAQAAARPAASVRPDLAQPSAATGQPEARAARSAKDSRAKRANLLGLDDAELDTLPPTSAPANQEETQASAGATDAEPLGATSASDADAASADGSATSPAPAADSVPDAASASVTSSHNAAAPAAESSLNSWALGALSLGTLGAAASLRQSGPEPVLAPVASLAVTSNSGSLADNITNAQKPVISGTGTPGQFIEVTTPTGEVLRTQVAADGSWQVQPEQALPEGTNEIRVVQMDGDGNASPTVNVTVVVDSIPSAVAAPQIALAADSGAADGVTQNNTPAIEGTGSAGDMVTVLIAGQTLTTTVGADGRWSVTPQALGDGKHAAEVTMTDAAGNISPVAVLGLMVDTTAPVLTIAPVAGNNLVNAAERSAVVVSGTATAEAGQVVALSFSDGSHQVTASAVVGADGTWALAQGADLSGLAQGAISIMANVSDLAGNASAAASASATLDTTIHAVADTATTTQAANISGNVMSNDTPVDGTEQVTLVGSATGLYGSLVLAADGNYTYTPAAATNAMLTAVQDNFTYRITDAAGNSAEQTLTVEVTPVNDAPTWAGTAEAVSMVEQTSTTMNGRGLHFADVDAGASVMQLTITGQAQDVLDFAAGSSGVTVVPNESRSTLVLSGTLEQLNALLASTGEATGLIHYSTLAYTAETAEGRAASELSFTISDLGHTGAGEALSATQTLAVEITADVTPLVANEYTESITVGGLGDDSISAGNAFNVALYGGRGNDVLTGGFDSQLHGGSGNDVLISAREGLFNSMEGGAGDDQFVVGSSDDHFLHHGRNTITDFRREEGNMDTLRLSGLFDADGNGVVDAQDLNHASGANRVDFFTSGGDLFMTTESMGAGLYPFTETRIQNGASLFTGNSADTLSSLLGSGALLIDPVPGVPPY